MTIEAVKEKFNWLGLRRERRARVLEYRSWEQEVSPVMTYHQSPDVALLHIAPIFKSERQPDDYFQFLHPLSDRSLAVNTKKDLLDDGKSIVYSGDAINKAHFKTVYGETIVFRETKPGDYPPLGPGKVDTTERVHRQNNFQPAP